MVYMISYDLRDPDRNYPKIKAAIESLGSSIRPLYSLWFVETNLPAADIRDFLDTAIDKNDRILVMKASQSWATMRVDQAYTNWMKAFIPSVVATY